MRKYKKAVGIIIGLAVGIFSVMLQGCKETTAEVSEQTTESVKEIEPPTGEVTTEKTVEIRFLAGIGVFLRTNLFCFHIPTTQADGTFRA